MSRRYRAIAAWRLGRPLLPWETVHHVDGCHEDDHPDNLTVLSGPREHALLHWYQRREAKGAAPLAFAGVARAAFKKPCEIPLTLPVPY